MNDVQNGVEKKVIKHEDKSAERLVKESTRDDKEYSNSREENSDNGGESETNEFHHPTEETCEVDENKSVDRLMKKSALDDETDLSSTKEDSSSDEEKDTSVWHYPVEETHEVDNANFTSQENLVKQSKQNKGLKKYYKMKRCVRTAIIFNHEHFDRGLTVRKGTQRDRSELEDILEKMQFTVTTFTDLKYAEVMAEIKKAASKKYSKRGCIMIVVMTHGKNNQLSAKDGFYNASDLWEPFREEKCPSLAKRPKMFILQACQGVEEDYGITVRTEVDSFQSSDYDFFTSPDFLIVYSTVPLYKSCRNKIDGSRMIQELVSGLKSFGKDKDILTLLTLVNQKVSLDYPKNSGEGLKQVMRIHSTLTRLLVLHESFCSII